MQYTIKSYFYIMLFFLTAACPAETVKGKVVGVQDGDTIDLLDRDQKYTIRLDGIDAPEIDQAFGQSAKKFTTDLCLGAVVTADISSKDKYGRGIAIVTLPDSTCLNEALLAAGLAWHYKLFNMDRTYAELEKSAKEKKLGLWDDENPTSPWKYRNKKDEEPKPDAFYEAKYVASVKSNTFHRPWCKIAKMIDNEDLIYFETIEEAEEKGLKPCMECNH